MSFNRFRGQNDLSLAVPLLPLGQELGLASEGITSLNFKRAGKRVIEFSEWIEPYDQDRRRQKPLSAGVGLRIQNEIVQEWLSARGLSLAYHIEVHRSVDKYRPEPQMSWQRCEGILAKNSATAIHTCRFDVDSAQAGYAPADAFF